MATQQHLPHHPAPVRPEQPTRPNAEIQRLAEELLDFRLLLRSIESLLSTWNAQSSRMTERAFRQELGAIFELLKSRESQLNELSNAAESLERRTEKTDDVSTAAFQADIKEPLESLQRTLQGMLVMSPGEILDWRQEPRTGEYQELQHG